jgi:TRAP-type C4-dicarboxylate transport system permease small subunit
LLIWLFHFLTAALRAVIATAVVIFYSFMALGVLLQVLGRYLFNYSIDWATETATFAQIWMVLLAAGLAMRRRLHVGVDVLVQAFPPVLQRLIILLTSALCLWFLWVAIQGSFRLISIGFIQTSPALAMPMWLPYLSLPVGLCYFAFEFLLAMIRRWRDPLADYSPQTGSAG